MELRLSSQDRKELDEMLLTSLQLLTALVEKHIALTDLDLQGTNRIKLITYVIDVCSVGYICHVYQLLKYTCILKCSYLLPCRNVKTHIAPVQQHLLGMKVHEKVTQISYMELHYTLYLAI